MLWLILTLLLFILTVTAANHDIARITHHLDYTYKIHGPKKVFLSRCIAGMIYFPAFVIIVFGGWLGKNHYVGEFVFCLLWLSAPLWILIGRVLTGGNMTAN